MNGGDTENGRLSGKPPRTWEGTVKSRGVAILLRFAMTLLNDQGNDAGKSTKCWVADIIRRPDGRFIFVLDAAKEDDREKLVGGEYRVNLSALQILFSYALDQTSWTDEQPEVTVAVRNPDGGEPIMPQELVPDSELEDVPEDWEYEEEDPEDA